MAVPSWVSGGETNDGSSRKYHRAVETLRKEGREVTEEAVKELYIKYNGLVIEQPNEDGGDGPVAEIPRRGRPRKVDVE